MLAVGITTLLHGAAMLSAVGALPVIPATNDGPAAVASPPLALDITPPRHFPHSPIRRHGDPLFGLSSNNVHASNSNDDKHSIYPKGQPGTLSLSVPLFAVLLFALIILATMGIAHCLYRRYARNLERAFGVHNDNNNNNSQVVGSYTWRFSNYNDVSDGGQEPTEHDRLLGGQPSQGRQRSTSYYDANRSWSAAPVAIQTDMKGRPITTWSTASSVAAQRGEELSRWSKRRDELIAQYGQGSMLPSRGGDSSSHQYSRQNQSGNYNSLAEDPDENAQERDGEEE